LRAARLPMRKRICTFFTEEPFALSKSQILQLAIRIIESAAGEFPRVYTFALQPCFSHKWEANLLGGD
jgi:hypothetical protein